MKYGPVVESGSGLLVLCASWHLGRADFQSGQQSKKERKLSLFGLSFLSFLRASQHLGLKLLESDSAGLLSHTEGRQESSRD